MTGRKKLDLSQLAKSIVDQATGESPKTKLATPKQLAGQKGGLKGGKARMEALSEAQRAELSRVAGEAKRGRALASSSRQRPKG